MKRSNAGIYSHMRAWRDRAGLTQEHVANILGISNTVFSEKERGVRRFKPEEIEKLVAIYGEEVWVMVAFAPDDPMLPAFKRAYVLLGRMRPEVADKWLGIGEVLVTIRV